MDQVMSTTAMNQSRSSNDHVFMHERVPFYDDRYMMANQSDQIQQILAQRDGEEEDEKSDMRTCSFPRGSEDRILIRKFWKTGT
jgi:hypothetical protein